MSQAPATRPAGRPRPAPLLLVLALLAALAASPVAAGDHDAATVLASVRVSPLYAELVLPAGPVREGQRFQVEALVFNRGDGRLRDLDASLHLLLAPCLRLEGAARHHRGLLAPDGALALAWRLHATSSRPSCRRIIVALSVTAVEDATGEDLAFDSPARLLEIR